MGTRTHKQYCTSGLLHVGGMGTHTHTNSTVLASLLHAGGVGTHTHTNSTVPAVYYMQVEWAHTHEQYCTSSLLHAGGMGTHTHTNSTVPAVYYM